MEPHALVAVAVAVRRWLILLLTAFLILFLGACTTADAEPVPRIGATGGDLSRSMTVYRSPDCSCCHVWANVARRAGWTVATADVKDMTAFKGEYGIPRAVQSCHTAIVGGYIVEGHVPLEALEDLLAQRPDIDGIALPGMPAGSPGMGGVAEGPFEVLELNDGTTAPFGSY
jgi:hypothetical protein